MARPIRVAVCIPNLFRNGVFQWLLDLVSHTDPHAIEWVGCLLSGKRRPHVDCAKKLARWLPIHCGDPCNWAGYYWARDTIRVHLTPQDAATAACGNADVVIAWELDESLEHLGIEAPILLVSHSTWWRPQPNTSATYFAAVSKAAAVPFEGLGLSTAIIHSGVSVDRCSRRLVPGLLRADWRAGPGHKVLLSLGRQDANKRPTVAGMMVKELGHRYKACIYGESAAGEVHSDVLRMAQESDGQIIARPWYDHVGDLYAESDLLVVPSCQESFGQTIVEAWMAGLPVLSPGHIGCIPEFEARVGALVYKFSGQTFDDAPTMAEYARKIVEENPDPEIIARAQAFARDYLTAPMMARRWEDHLRSLNLVRSSVIPVSRTTRTRWRTADRPIRAVLYCRRLTAEIRGLVQMSGEQVHWLALVVTEPELDDCTGRLNDAVIVTDLSGPGHAERWHDLRDGLHFHAKVADVVVVSDLPYADTGLSRTTAPAVGLILPSDNPAPRTWHSGLPHVLQTLATPEALPKALAAQCPAAEPLVRPVKALMLCPHLGWGGSEKWMEFLFLHPSQSVEWVGCVQIWNDTFNSAMAVRFQEAGVVVSAPPGPYELPEGVRQEYSAGERVAQLLLEFAPDIIVFWGLEKVGQYIPAGFRGPVVCMSHGVATDDWTRRWVSSSSPYASHYAAASFLALGSYPAHLQEQVDVIYPGVEFPEIQLDSDQRLELRQEFGFSPEDRIITYVGRGDPAKQPLKVAEIVAQLPDEYKVLWVGDHSDYPGDLEKDLRKLVPGRYVKLDYTNQIDRVMAITDVLILLSRYESFGMVILQALQQGCRVLATPVSIAGELAGDPAGKVAARLVYPDAPLEVLTEAVVELAQQPRADFPKELEQRYGATGCADQFHKYLQQVGATAKEGVGISLFSLVQAEPDWSEVERPRSIACDAVIALTGDKFADSKAVNSLLRQTEAAVFVHAVGTPESCQAVADRLGEEFWRVRFVRQRHQSTPFGNLYACLPHYRTDVVLLARPGSVSLPDRANLCSRYITGAGLEFVIGAAQGWRSLSQHELAEEWSTLAIRKGTIVDLSLGETLPRSAAELIEHAKNRNRSYQLLEVPVCRITQQCRTAFSDGEPMTHSGSVEVDMVLPFKGQFDLLSETVSGVLSQDYATVHLHLVASGSTNDQELAEFKSRYRERMVGVHFHWYKAKADIGQFLSANAIVPRMQTDILLIQDGDDISEPNRAWVTAKSMAAAGADLFSSAVRAFGGELRILAASYPRPGSWYYAPNPSCAISKKLMLELGGYADFGNIDRNRTSLDTEFFMRAYAHQAATQISAYPLVRYRQHPGSCVNDGATGFRSGARRFVELEMIKYARALQKVPKGCLAACADLISPY